MSEGRLIRSLNSYSVSYEAQVRSEGWPARLVGSAGRLLISFGLLILAFAAYQLWGTGVLQDRTQSGLAGEFENYEAAVLADRSSGGELSSGLAESEIGSMVAPQLSPIVVPASSIERGPGEVVGRIRAERIDLDQFIVEGVDPTQLQAGPGHYPGTPMPGMMGNASVAGHRTTWGAPSNRIDELLPGDEIEVDMPWGTATYVVDPHDDGDGSGVGNFIVDPSKIEVLDQDGSNRLTLTSCHPKFSARLRIIVTASLVSEPIEIEGGFEAVVPGSLADEDLDASAASSSDEALAERLPGLTDDDQVIESVVGQDDEESFGEGLSGDRSAIAPAMAWSLIASGAWILTRVVARRWRRWLTYAVAVLPVAALWLIAFGFIDQAIPSY